MSWHDDLPKSRPVNMKNEVSAIVECLLIFALAYVLLGL